jgi:hypothetical protein
MHCTENRIYVFPEKELRGFSPNSYIHVSVRDLYIFPGSAHISCSKTDRLILEIYKFITDPYMSVEIGTQNIIILFWK